MYPRCVRILDWLCCTLPDVAALNLAPLSAKALCSVRSLLPAVAALTGSLSTHCPPPQIICCWGVSPLDGGSGHPQLNMGTALTGHSPPLASIPTRRTPVAWRTPCSLPEGGSAACGSILATRAMPRGNSSRSVRPPTQASARQTSWCSVSAPGGCGTGRKSRPPGLHRRWPHSSVPSTSSSPSLRARRSTLARSRGQALTSTLSM